MLGCVEKYHGVAVLYRILHVQQGRTPVERVGCARGDPWPHMCAPWPFHAPHGCPLMPPGPPTLGPGRDPVKGFSAPEGVAEDFTAQDYYK